MYVGEGAMAVKHTLDNGNNDESYGSANDIVNAKGGRDFIYTDGGDDILRGQADGDDLYAGVGKDIVHGGDGNDDLYGEEGNDKLYGGNDYDDLYGGPGKDQLYGGPLNDDYYGGPGKDTFIFKNLGDITGDQIFDFSHPQQDEIDLSALGLTQSNVTIPAAVTGPFGDMVTTVDVAGESLEVHSDAQLTFSDLIF
jgi:serralysin